MTNKGIALVILSILLSSLQLGCVSAPAKQVEIFWPPYPEEPRIAYVQGIQGTWDTQESSFLDTLLGGSGGSLFFQKPYGISALGDKIYVANSTGNSVTILDRKLNKVASLTSTDETDLRVPIGVAVTADGRVFVSDILLGRVFVFNAEGAYQLTIGAKGEMIKPAGLAVNSGLGRVYISDSKLGVVHVYSLDGKRLFSFAKEGEGDGELHNPTNIAIDRTNDNIIVTDTSNFRIQIFDKEGKFLRKFGELGDVPGTFSRPKGVGIDSDGNIYVVDTAFNNVQIYSNEGVLLTFLGGPGNNPGYFSLPAGLYVDGDDRIYVTEQINNRVQIFQYLSTKWKREHPDEYAKYVKRSADLAEQAELQAKERRERAEKKKINKEQQSSEK